MELKEMRTLNYKELLEKLKEAQRKLFDLKMQLANQQLKNFMQISQLRQEIARMQTVLAEKRVKGEHVVKIEKEVKAEKPVEKKKEKESEKTNPVKAKKEKSRGFFGSRKKQEKVQAKK